MKILVICGAGASSTFVAQRLRRAAVGAGVELSASAGAMAMPGGYAIAPTLVLLGAHLAPEHERLRAAFAPTPVHVLPDDIGRDLDGSRTLSIVLDTVDTADDAGVRPAERASSDQT